MDLYALRTGLLIETGLCSQPVYFLRHPPHVIGQCEDDPLEGGDEFLAGVADVPRPLAFSNGSLKRRHFHERFVHVLFERLSERLVWLGHVLRQRDSFL